MVNTKKLNYLNLLIYFFSGIPGELIDQGIAKPIKENTFTPVSMFTTVSLQDMVDNEKGRQKHIKKGKLKFTAI